METKKNRSVFVIYEDESARAAAVSFCDQLIERFWTRCGFDIAWASFEELKDVARAQVAVEQAASADAIVFSSEPFGWLPAEVRQWAELWVAKRGEREGIFIGLGDSDQGVETSNKFTWVRGIARRAGCDYLTHAPERLDTIPEGLESYSQRASTVTSVLDEILRNHPLPKL